MHRRQIVLEGSNKLLFLRRFLSSHGSFETSTRSETRHRGSCNLEFLAGLRIATDAGSTLRGLECAESNQGGGIALGYSFHDGSNDCIQRTRGSRLGQVRFLGVSGAGIP